MLALTFSAFVASLLGSPHCAGMCGPFVPLAVPLRSRGARTGVARSLLAFHGGRLVSYLAMGVLAGSFGALLEHGGAMLGVQRAAALLAGATMIAVGVIGIARRLGARLPLAGSSSSLARVLHGITAAAGRLSPTRRAVTIGLVTALMPCGWSYAFAVAAAGTGSVGLGALTMLALWLGTLPALTAVGFVAQRASPRVRARLPWVISIVLIAMGAYAMAFRAPIVPVTPATATVPSEAPCH
jgi:sulfite exporter TauE/SafE